MFKTNKTKNARVKFEDETAEINSKQLKQNKTQDQLDSNQITHPDNQNQKIRKYDKFDYYEFKSIDCTFVNFGKVFFDQPQYFCPVCDPNRNEPICKTCYLECHGSCYQSSGHLTEDAPNEAFQCNCGIKKHFIEKVDRGVKEKEIICCMTKFIDISLENKYKYSCPNCYINNLCYLCYKNCHENCKNRMKVLLPDNSIDLEKCDCNLKNHRNLLGAYSLLYDLSNTVTFSYESKAFIWPLQVMNSIADNTYLYDSFLYPTEYYSDVDVSRDIKKVDTRISHLTIILAKFMANSAIFYYYHPRYENFFPFDKLFIVLKNLINDSIIQQDSAYISGLLTIMLNCHLKQDFENIKIYCVHDFLVTSIRERINYKLSLRQKSNYTENTHSKYFNTNEKEKKVDKTRPSVLEMIFGEGKKKEKNINQSKYLEKLTVKETFDCMLNEKTLIGELAIYSVKLLEHAFKISNSKKSCIKTYFVCFRIIFISLKIMVLTKDELETIIKHFHSFLLEFQDFLEVILNTINEVGLEAVKKEFNTFIFKIMNYILKIIFLIAVQCNDLTIIDYIYRLIIEKYNHIEQPIQGDEFFKDLGRSFNSFSTNSNSNGNYYSFIHQSTENNILIFKSMIISTGYFIDTMFRKLGGWNYEDNSMWGFLNLQLHLMSLFSQQANFYLQQIQNFPFAEYVFNLINFESFVLQQPELTVKLKNGDYNVLYNKFSRLKIDSNEEIDEKARSMLFNKDFYESNFKQTHIKFDLITDNEYYKNNNYNLFSTSFCNYKLETEYNLKLFFNNKIDLEDFFELILESTKEFEANFYLIVLNYKDGYNGNNGNNNNGSNPNSSRAFLNSRLPQLGKKSVIAQFESQLFNFSEFDLYLTPFDKDKLDFKALYIFRREIIRAVWSNSKVLAKALEILLEVNNDDLTYQLIHSKINSFLDNTLTKIFMIDFKFARYNQAVLLRVFSVLYMYTFTKSGLEVLITGRTFRRLIKLFESFPVESINFFHKVLKGVYLYNLNLKYHKKLKPLMNMICDFFTNNEYITFNLTEDEVNELHFCSIRIAFYVRNFFNLEDLRRISNKILSHITKEKLVSYQVIEKSFDLENFLKWKENRKYNIHVNVFKTIFHKNFSSGGGLADLEALNKPKEKNRDLFSMLKDNAEKKLIKEGKIKPKGKDISGKMMLNIDVLKSQKHGDRNYSAKKNNNTNTPKTDEYVDDTKADDSNNSKTKNNNKNHNKKYSENDKSYFNNKEDKDNTKYYIGIQDNPTYSEEEIEITDDKDDFNQIDITNFLRDLGFLKESFYLEYGQQMRFPNLEILQKYFSEAKKDQPNEEIKVGTPRKHISYLNLDMKNMKETSFKENKSDEDVDSINNENISDEENLDNIHNKVNANMFHINIDKLHAKGEISEDSYKDSVIDNKTNRDKSNQPSSSRIRLVDDNTKDDKVNKNKKENKVPKIPKMLQVNDNDENDKSNIINKNNKNNNANNNNNRSNKDKDNNVNKEKRDSKFSSVNLSGVAEDEAFLKQEKNKVKSSKNNNKDSNNNNNNSKVVKTKETHIKQESKTPLKQVLKQSTPNTITNTVDKTSRVKFSKDTKNLNNPNSNSKRKISSNNDNNNNKEVQEQTERKRVYQKFESRHYKNLLLNDDIYDNSKSKQIQSKNYSLSSIQLLFFSLLEFIAESSFIFYTTEEYSQKVQELVDIELLSLLMKKNLFPIKYRTIILKFFKTYCFSDIVNPEFNQVIDKYSTGNEKYLFNNFHKKRRNNKTEESKEYFGFKASNLKTYTEIIDVMYLEWSNFEIICWVHQEDLKDLNDYLVQIVLLTKVCFDTLLTQDITNTINVHLIRLLNEVKNHVDNFNRIYNRVFMYDAVEGLLLNNKFMHDDGIHTHFDNWTLEQIYDPILIFNTFSEVLKEIVERTDLGKFMAFDYFLMKYNTFTKSNYRPFGLSTNFLVDKLKINSNVLGFNTTKHYLNYSENSESLLAARKQQLTNKMKQSLTTKFTRVHDQVKELLEKGEVVDLSSSRIKRSLNQVNQVAIKHELLIVNNNSSEYDIGRILNSLVVNYKKEFEDYYCLAFVDLLKDLKINKVFFNLLRHFCKELKVLEPEMFTKTNLIINKILYYQGNEYGIYFIKYLLEDKNWFINFCRQIQKDTLINFTLIRKIDNLDAVVELIKDIQSSIMLIDLIIIQDYSSTEANFKAVEENQAKAKFQIIKNITKKQSTINTGNLGNLSKLSLNLNSNSKNNESNSLAETFEKNYKFNNSPTSKKSISPRTNSNNNTGNRYSSIVNKKQLKFDVNNPIVEVKEEDVLASTRSNLKNSTKNKNNTNTKFSLFNKTKEIKFNDNKNKEINSNNNNDIKTNNNNNENNSNNSDNDSVKGDTEYIKNAFTKNVTIPDIDQSPDSKKLGTNINITENFKLNLKSFRKKPTITGNLSKNKMNSFNNNRKMQSARSSSSNLTTLKASHSNRNYLRNVLSDTKGNYFSDDHEMATFGLLLRLNVFSLEKIDLRIKPGDIQPYDKLIILFDIISSFLLRFIFTSKNKIISNFSYFYKFFQPYINFINYRYPFSTTTTSTEQEKLGFFKVLNLKLESIRIINNIIIGSCSNEVFEYFNSRLNVEDILNEIELLIDIKLKELRNKKMIFFTEIKNYMELNEMKKLYYHHEEEFTYCLYIKVIWNYFIYIYILKNNYKDFKTNRLINTILSYEENDEGVISYTDEHGFVVISEKIDMSNIKNSSGSNNNFKEKLKKRNEFSSALKKKYILKFAEIFIKSLEIVHNNTNMIYYFVYPPMSYFLSQNTKEEFLHNCNRESAMSKLSDFLASSDYFIFETIFNSKFYKGTKNIGLMSYLSLEFNFVTLEKINFVIIIVNQILVFMNNFDREMGDNREVLLSNYFISVIQIVFCFVSVVMFLVSKYKLCFYKSIIKDRNNLIIQNKQINKYLLSHDGYEYISTKLTSSLRWYSYIYYGFIKTIIFNYLVNLMIFTIICNAAFLSSGNVIPLIIQTLFVAVFSDILIGILKAFLNRLEMLLSVLFITFIIVFLYSTTAYYTLNNQYTSDSSAYYFKDWSTNQASQTRQEECGSYLSCVLYNISYGIRSGGGIGDMLPFNSLITEPGVYVGRIIYDMSFFIVVIAFMGNIFMGIILDAFASLRDRISQQSVDKEYTCFICQLPYQYAMMKNINFESHREIDHNIWNYFGFIYSLMFNNSKEFEVVESYVFKMLQQNNKSWIPNNYKNLLE